MLSRLDSLPLGQRDTLQAGSVAGVEFRYGEVRALVPGTTDESSLRARLAALESGRLLLLAREGTEAQYAFRQTLVREIGYRSQSLARRRELHGKLAEYLSASYGGQGSDQAGQAEVLAHHYEQAERPLPAARYLLLSAGNACRRYAHRQGRGFLDRALAAFEILPAEQRDSEAEGLLVQVHEARGDLALLAADFEAAAVAYKAARAVLENGALPTSVQLKLALVLAVQGEAEAAEALARQAWERAEAGQELACAATRAWLAWRRGDDQAGRWIETSVALAAAEPGSWAAGIGALLADLGGDGAAAREAYLALDQLPGAALVACREGDVHLQAGEMDPALEWYDRAAGWWQAEGDAWGLALARYRQAEAYVSTGDLAAARSALEEAQDLLAAAPAAAAEDAEVVRGALDGLELGQGPAWSSWCWQRYDDLFRISLLFRPWWAVQAALPGD
jgi:adenylate cyclase